MFLEILQPCVFHMPELSDDAFFDFCSENDQYRIERTPEGKAVVKSGTGGLAGFRNSVLTAQLCCWAMAESGGVSFESSTMFRLPNSAMRSPDASWVSLSRWKSLTREQRRKYIPLCPEFVVELISPSDRLPDVSAKMSEWVANGAQLGWIIDGDERKVHIYRQGQPVEVLSNPANVKGEGPVAGFTLDLSMIFESEL